MFGEEATHLIYQYLERRHRWSQREFSEKIDVFAKGLEEFFSTGAYMIESKILDKLSSNYDTLRSVERESNFARQILLATQKT